MSWHAQCIEYRPDPLLFAAAYEAELHGLGKIIADSTSRIEEVHNIQRDNTRGILKTQKAAERHLTKRQTLLARKEECNRNLRDLGILPTEAYTKYTKEKSEKVGWRSLSF